MSLRKYTKRHPNFKGGSIASNGYRLIYVGKDHHLADVRGYAYEHRIVAEKVVGRELMSGEIIHHKNGNKLDNATNNIEVMPSRFDHKVKHRRTGLTRRLPRQENPIVSCGCGCGETFPLFDKYDRPRKFLGGHWRKGRKGGGVCR